jgi:hypothetical protein
VASSSVAVKRPIVDRNGRTWTPAELVALIGRADKGDAPALSTLQSFDASQWWWTSLGDDVAEEAEESLIAASAPREAGRLAVRRILERTRAELAGPGPTPLVRLAARRAAIAGLEADLAQRSSARSLEKGLVPT